MGYELRQEDIYGLASQLNAQTIRKGDELNFKRCPYCNGGGHDDETFSINLISGAYKCLRAKCDVQGHFVQLARDFNYPLDFGDDKPKKYKQLPQVKFEIRDTAIKYLVGRGISEPIAREYKITTGNKDKNVMVFPFYDENNVLTFIKYRKLNYVKGRDKNKEWCESGAEPILFGMAQCDTNLKRLIVTEGQLDSLSVASAGFRNAVSVPTGQSGFGWVKRCYEWMDNFDEIIIFGDNEHGHITLVDGFVKHFGQKKLKVVRSEDYLGEKDANDILQKYGTVAIKDCIDNAQEILVTAVKKLADVEAVDLESLEHIRTGLYELDKRIGGIYMGQVVVLTGKRGEGKSTLASQIIANALDQSDNDGQPYSVFIYSGELSDYHFKRWLDLQIAGTRNIVTTINEYNDETYSLTAETVEKINAWYNDRAYIFDNTAVDNEDVKLLETIEMAIRRYNTKLILIDNLMTALDVDMDKELYRAQSEFVNAIKRMAVKYNVAIILIAHPRKTPRGEKLDNESISGSGDITNRVDTVITYGRDGDIQGQSKISIVKNRLTGRTAEGIIVEYSKKCKRIVCAGNNVERDRVYGCFVDKPEDDTLPPF